MVRAYLNQVVKVNPFSYGHFDRGGRTMADPRTPGKLKKTSGPDRWGICFNTLISFLE